MKTKSAALSAFCNPRVLAGFVICLAGLTLGFFALVARATPPLVITVNTLMDETTPGDSLCSLREAITNANDNTQTYPECAAGSGANAIAFSVSGTITLGSTLPAINDDVTIDGSGRITISGNNSVQVMFVSAGKTLTLHSLTIANGRGLGAGGIFNSGGTVNVINSFLSGNSAGGVLLTGGGIFNGGGTVNVTNSTFSGNSAPQNVGGGGICNSDGTVNVTNSTFSGNSASFGGGGGILNTGSGTVNVSDSTFSGNNSTISGAGGISNQGGTLNVSNSTFSGNSTNSGAGGISNQGGTATLKNTIIANSTSGGNCSGSITADSHNLADDNTCGSATVATSAQINLQPLANNGGPTQTMALGSGSVAIDAGDETVCAVPPVNEFDQRGVTRPRDGDGDHIAICDTGSYEASAPIPTPTPRGTPAPRPRPTPRPR